MEGSPWNGKVPDALGWFLVFVCFCVLAALVHAKWQEQRFYAIVSVQKPGWVQEFRQLSRCEGGFLGGEARGARGKSHFVVKLAEGRAYFRDDWYDSLCRSKT